MGGQMEIITGVERRRRWRVADKLRILAELDEPGVKFNDVARRHDLSRGLLWRWRDAHRCGQLAEDAPVFLPVRVAMEQPRPALPRVPAPCAQPFRRERTRSGRIEIVLPDGVVLRIDAGVSTAALRGVLAVLRG
jgi:transposase